MWLIRWSVLLLLLLPTIAASGQIVPGNHVICNGSTCSTSPIDTTGASLITICTSGYYRSGPPTSSPANAWNCLTKYAASGGTYFAQLCYAYNPNTSASQTFVVNATYGVLSVRAYSGTKTTADPLQPGSDVGNSSSSTKTLAATAAITPSQTGELISGCWVYDGAFTGLAVTGLSITDSSNNGCCERGADADLVDSSTAPINPSWSVTSSASLMAVAAAAFLPAATPKTCTLATMGAGPC